MTLHQPFQISSRLLPALRVGNDWIQLEFSGETRDGRDRMRWTLDIAGSEYTGNDLKSGVGGCTLQEGFVSLLSFLTAAAESLAYRERRGEEITQDDNASLFPLPVAQWARQHSEELTSLQFEIEETPDLIV